MNGRMRHPWQMADTHPHSNEMLDRYISGATPSEREEARDNLCRLARLIIRVHQRLATDNPQSVTRASADSALESESPPTSI